MAINFIEWDWFLLVLIMGWLWLHKNKGSILVWLWLSTSMEGVDYCSLWLLLSISVDWIILRYVFSNLSSSPSVLLGKMRWISDIVCIPEVVIWVVGYPSIIRIVKIIMTLSHFLVQRRNSGHDFSFSMIAWLMLFMFSCRHIVAMWYYERRLLWGMLLLWEVLLSGL